jgi:hypothetical protein
MLNVAGAALRVSDRRYFLFLRAALAKTMAATITTIAANISSSIVPIPNMA